MIFPDPLQHKYIKWADRDFLRFDNNKTQSYSEPKDSTSSVQQTIFPNEQTTNFVASV